MAPALIYGLAIVVAVALQTSMPGLVEGVRPALALVIVSSIGLVWGPVEGVGAGFWAGLLVASLAARGVGAPFGGILTAYMVVGFLAGKLRGGVFSERAVIALIVGGLAVVLAELITMIFEPPAALGPWAVGVAIEAPLTAALAVPVHLFVRFVHARLSERLPE